MLQKISMSIKFIFLPFGCSVSKQVSNYTYLQV